MSEFSCPVIKVNNIRKHPNADALEIVDVFETPCIVRKGQLKLGDLAVYVPVEAVIPMTNPVFQGLGIKSDKDKYRVKAVRLRGEYSEGLLVPVNGPYADEGEDAAPTLGIVKYEEPEAPTGGLNGKVKSQQERDLPWVPKYGVESILKNREAIREGTDVVVTEKIHGCNARYVYAKDPHGVTRLNVGSHNTWKRPIYRTKYLGFKQFINKLRPGTFKLEPINDDVWWEVAKTLDLESKLKRHPECVFYGEIFGKVQDLKYSVEGVSFRIFDIYNANMKRWYRPETVREVAKELGLGVVPTLYEGPYKRDVVDPLRNGTSVVDGKTIREGIVIKPAFNEGKFIAYKYVGENYKLRSGPTTEFH